MFKLFRYYSVASAAAIVVVTIAVVVLYRNHAVNDIVEAAEYDNLVLARTFSNILWPEFAAYIERTDETDGGALRGNPETRKIHAALSSLTTGLPVLKVKIYNLDGITIYSSQPSQIGQDKSENPGFSAARHRGKPTSKLSFREKFAAFSGQRRNLHVVESYLPVQDNGPYAKGVFELYTDVTPKMRHVDRTTAGLGAVTFLVFAVLYGVLALIVWRADKILRRQYSDLKRSEENIGSKNAELMRRIAERNIAERALQAAHDELEARVRDRTEDLRREVAGHEETHAALRERDAQLSAALKLGNLGHWTWHIADNSFEGSDALHEIYGLPEAESLSYETVTGAIHEDERPAAGESRCKAIAEKRGYAFAFRIIRADGETGYVEGATTPLYGKGGEVIGFFGVTQDVTLRRKLEAELRQVQKLEVVGQLAGGIAHEFNNLLMAVGASMELLESRLRGNEELLRYVDTAMRATRRGAELTDQMLSYGRRQMLTPEVLDVNDVILQTVGLLRHTLGAEIEIETDLSDKLWPSEIDSGQLESVLLNLAINARDAMSGNGKLAISTRNLPERVQGGRGPADMPNGEYIAVGIKDDGMGMAPETIARAFEPFFTTKDVGKGSGLGLSMVHGFAKQSGGDVTIDSEVGKGTEITLYLPRASAASDAAIPEETPECAQPDVSGTVLVVEDDPLVRESLVALVTQAGYLVEQAEDGTTALTLLDSQPDIELVLADIVMPGAMNGIALAAEVRRRRPGAKILLISGYPDTEIEAKGLSTRGLNLLRKPFNTEDLMQALRAAA